MKKSVLIASSVMAAVLLVGGTALGANELGLFNNKAEAEISKTLEETGNVREIVTELDSFRYPELVLEKGVPVKWTMTVDEKNLNGCNNEIIIPSLGISWELNPGENVIEFTPEETGVIQYSCWMGMIGSTIAVVDDINNYNPDEIKAQISELPKGGGVCCGSGGSCH